jgi:hypothetical protein
VVPAVRKQFLTDAAIVFAVVAAIVFLWLALLDKCKLESDIECVTATDD